MKIAITGATGLIGKAFIEKYSNNFELVAISRKPEQENCIYSDFSFNSLCHIFENVDALIHLAGERLHKLESLETTSDLDEIVLLAAKNAGLQNIVLASSRGVYGKNKSPWHESTNVSPTNFYSLKKAQTELLCNYLNNSHGLKIKCLRIAQVLSENEYEGSMIRVFLDSAVKAENLHVTVSGITREYIYILDLVDAIYTAVKHDSEYGIYNVGTGVGVNIEEIATIISKTFDNGCKVIVNDNLTEVSENSVMAVNLFRQTFDWSPAFTFETAIKDIEGKISGV